MLLLYHVSSLPFCTRSTQSQPTQSQYFQAQSLADIIFITMNRNTTATTQLKTFSGNLQPYPQTGRPALSGGEHIPMPKVPRKEATEPAATAVELNWHCHPLEYCKAFIEFRASELAKQGGFDEVAFRSTIHNTTRGPVPKPVPKPVRGNAGKRVRGAGSAARNAGVPYNRTTRVANARGIERIPRPIQACDYHFTADFHNPDTSLWEPAHIYTLTKEGW